MKVTISLCCLALFLAGCSSSPPPAGGDVPQNAAQHDQLCSDPQWKAAHLGLWFDLCRQNAM